LEGGKDISYSSLRLAERLIIKEKKKEGSFFLLEWKNAKKGRDFKTLVPLNRQTIKKPLEGRTSIDIKER